MTVQPEPTEPNAQDELSVVSGVFAGIGENGSGDFEATTEPDPVMRYTQGGSPC